MSVEAWADAARQSAYVRTFEHQRAIDTLQAVLEGKTPPKAAANTIASLYEPVIKARSDKYAVATLWTIFCGAVRALGGNKVLAERLVDLLNSVSQLPDVTDEHGNAFTPYWTSEVYWRGLPELKIIFMEDAMDIQCEDEMEWDEVESGYSEKYALPLLNATTFGAIYLNKGKQPISMAYHAEASFIGGIEVPYQTPDQQREAEMYVPPAATWILLAGEKMYELCKSDYNRRECARISCALNSWLWFGDRGYSLGRWEYWKQRFSEIAMTQGLQDSVKDIAARALSKMGMIESQMK